MVSERHIKAYEADADPEPMPHKDRYATQDRAGLLGPRPARFDARDLSLR